MKVYGFDLTVGVLSLDLEIIEWGVIIPGNLIGVT